MTNENQRIHVLHGAGRSWDILGPLFSRGGNVIAAGDLADSPPPRLNVRSFLAKAVPASWRNGASLGISWLMTSVKASGSVMGDSQLFTNSFFLYISSVSL